LKTSMTNILQGMVDHSPLMMTTQPAETHWMSCFGLVSMLMC